MNTPASRILVGMIGRVFWMRVEGKGTFQNSIQAKTAFQSIMARGVRNLVVDLDRCPMMDSTFLGMLTGAALSVKTATPAPVNDEGLSVVNANQRNIQLLTSLGLDNILNLDLDGKMWAAERERACAASCEYVSRWRRPRQRTLLDFFPVGSFPPPNPLASSSSPPPPFPLQQRGLHALRPGPGRALK